MFLSHLLLLASVVNFPPVWCLCSLTWLLSKIIVHLFIFVPFWTFWTKSHILQTACFDGSRLDCRRLLWACSKKEHFHLGRPPSTAFPQSPLAFMSSSYISPLPSYTRLSVYGFMFTRTYTARMIYGQQLPVDLYSSTPAVVCQSGSSSACQINIDLSRCWAKNCDCYYDNIEVQTFFRTCYVSEIEIDVPLDIKTVSESLKQEFICVKNMIFLHFKTVLLSTWWIMFQG